jgi:hypothetical protein
VRCCGNRQAYSTVVRMAVDQEANTEITILGIASPISGK